jgi:hypothetical protein
MCQHAVHPDNATPNNAARMGTDQPAQWQLAAAALYILKMYGVSNDMMRHYHQSIHGQCRASRHKRADTQG